MTLAPRYRNILIFAAVLELLALAYRYWPDSSSVVVAPVSDSVGFSEKRLAKLRDTAATVPARQEILNKVNAELATREKGLIVADTAAQAQAQLIQIVRALGNAETPPVDIRSTEGFTIRPLGEAYGEASVSVQIECHIDQLVNMMAGLAARPELVSTSELRIGATQSKEKTVTVHLTVAGVVPRKLVPAKRT